MIQEFHLLRNKDGDFDRHRVRNWIGGPIRSGKANVDFIQEIAKSRDQHPLVQRLRLDTVDNIQRTNYASGVIQSAQLFELWIIQAFIIIAKENGLSEQEARSEITEPDGDFMHPNNILDKVGSELGYRVKTESAKKVENWSTQTKDVRNEVIHRGYEPDRSESSAAFEAAMELILDIQQQFRSDLMNGKLNGSSGHAIPGSNILMGKNDDAPSSPPSL
jgi:hypothetical protein